MKFRDYCIDFSNESILIVWQEDGAYVRLATPLEELMFQRLLQLDSPAVEKGRKK